MNNFDIRDHYHGRSRPIIPVIYLLLLLHLPLALAGSFDGRRYAAYDYDLTTPLFTPDGRLLQVEYATRACIREDSNPLVCVGLHTPEDDDTLLIMATVSQPSTLSTSLSAIQSNNPRRGDNTDDQIEKQDEEEVSAFLKRGSHRAQFRIIEVPLSVYYSCSLRRPTTSTILVGLSGLLSDASALLRTIYSELEDEQRMLGWHRLGYNPIGINAVDEDGSSISVSKLPRSRMCQPIFTQPSETVLRLSRAISDECQKHAFGGGLRPLGASLLLAGVDTLSDTLEGSNNSRTMHGARVAVCETHPNGGLRTTVYRGKNGDDTSPQIMITGGSVNSQLRLKRLLRNQFDKVVNVEVMTDTNNNAKSFLRESLRTVILSLVEEWSSRGDSTKSSMNSLLKQPALPRKLPQMEVVISSSKQGAFRLTENDIARIVKTKTIHL